MCQNISRAYVVLPSIRLHSSLRPSVTWDVQCHVNVRGPGGAIILPGQVDTIQEFFVTGIQIRVGMPVMTALTEIISSFIRLMRTLVGERS